MKIHLLAALILVLFSTADAFAQYYPGAPTGPTPYFPNSTPDWYDSNTNWDWDWDGTTTQETISEIGEWVHFEEEDTATEKVYRRYNPNALPQSKTPHVVSISYRPYQMTNLSRAFANQGTYGTWQLNSDNNVVVTLDDDTKYVFRTDRMNDHVLIMIK